MWPAFIMAMSPFLLCFRRAWIPVILSAMLFASTAIWVHTLYTIVAARMEAGADWLRLSLILASVALLNLISAMTSISLRRSDRYTPGKDNAPVSAAAFMITVVILATSRFMSPVPVLLADRFLPGSGWLEIAVLGIYASWVSEILLTSNDTSIIRVRLWAVFSICFFSQFLLGVTGLERFLMTGSLHIPVPALIVAGPLYRGGGFFMLILFLTTVVLAGPAWCSHLCYIGAWDNIAARRKPIFGNPQGWIPVLRIIVTVAVILLALLYGLTGVSMTMAGWTAVLFGIAGIIIMIAVSGRSGRMAHCTVWCPIGLLADVAGKLNPFRIKIHNGCTECGQCTSTCRYGALTAGDIVKKRPGLTCSLCGDCLKACGRGYISYAFSGLGPERSRMLFIAIIVSLHAAFLGMARI